MLIWEKLLLHVDGSGDFQWADIFLDQKVEIPRIISEYRKTENLLRIIVENAVSHHTTMPLRYYAESSPDRVAREKALIDQLWINDLAYEQDFNGLFGEALTMAMCTGFSPAHAYWRDDVSRDWYEAAGYGGSAQSQLPQPGMLDCFHGNPFDMVFDRAATKNSIRWASYSRLLPGDVVRKCWPQAASLQGSTRIPSTASLQRIMRTWQMAGLGVHGNPVIENRRGNDDLITVICRETAPGQDSDWPDGRLQIIAVAGHVDAYRGEGGGAHVIELANQPLPAGDFSFECFYSHTRGNDVHGKPWVEDLDQLQVDLNLSLSKRWEAINKLIEAPIVAPGGAINEDMTDLGGYNLLEVEPSLAAWRPGVMQWPSAVIQDLDKECEQRRRALYTIGGYQASSRGEAPGSRMAFKAIQALQEADRSIHGPVNVRFKRSATNFARRCWRQMKAYGDVPHLISIVGDEYAHLTDPYIDSSKLSDRPPVFKLVNSFGTSPEMHGQELIALMQVKGSDGMPFLRTDEARRSYPQQSIFDNSGNPDSVRRRRAKTIAQAFLKAARQVREQTGFQGVDPGDPQVLMFADEIFQQMEIQYQRLRDDDLMAHLATYTEIIQDETADVIARRALIQRQELYFLWQEDQARMAAEAEQGEEGEGGEPAPAKKKLAAVA